jgi:hypothetical protein
MMNFKAKTEYTAEETRKKLIEAFLDPASKFRGASKDMASTWDGLLGMAADRWFEFRNKVMDSGLFEGLKAKIQWILGEFNRLTTEGVIDKWAAYTAQAFQKSINLMIKSVGFFAKSWYSVKHVWDAVWQYIYKGLEWLFQKFADLERWFAGMLNRLPDFIKKHLGIEGYLATAGDTWENASGIFGEMSDEYGAKALGQLDKIEAINKAVESLQINLGTAPTANIGSGKEAPGHEDLKQLSEGLNKGKEEADKTLEELTPKMQKIADGIKAVFDAMGNSLADFFQKFAESGKLNIKALAQSLLKELQAVAAQKTARLLMEGAYNQVMTFIYTAAQRPDLAATAQAAASAAFATAPIFASFVVGSGLAGMAHSGISAVPEDGTWLLEKGERVLDRDTNKDLKDYLKGGQPQIVNNIEINATDGKSVERVMPQLTKAIEDGICKNIAQDGAIRQTIIKYTQ